MENININMKNERDLEQKLRIVNQGLTDAEIQEEERILNNLFQSVGDVNTSGIFE
uniref:Uncharacterized protein n=1 Tax=Octopus bimaculoides TaxID=37653 RepID=A0A0L8FVU1_OCTBM